MLFKYPSVLYAFLVLLIPIIIHLFKLRKFQQTAFTNVLFLEKIKIQSRKSSRLKKWLVLLSRLAVFSFLVLAFAFPYLPAKSKVTAPNNYIIYLDNSFSMQAKGTNGKLLEKAVQDILTQFEETTVFSLFTNTETYKDVQLSEIQNELLDIDYVEEQLSPEQILLKSKKLSKNKNASALIAISDFQKKKDFDFELLSKKANQIIQLKPQNTNNTAIDSLWISTSDEQKILHIVTSSSLKSKNIALSVFNKEKLIGKVSLDFSKNSKIISEVPLQNNITIEGLVSIENTEGLQFDDRRFFSINQTDKPKVLVIGNAFFNFLQKIYNQKEFDFSSIKPASNSIEDLNKVDLVILNENDTLSDHLKQQIVAFTKSGGLLCIIPSSKSIESLQTFLKENYNITIGDYIKSPKKLTQINFQHKLFNNVFTKQILNFQYPSVKKSYALDSKNWILNLEDNTPFLIQKDNVFLFASPLNEEITNFKKSPLIVPVFYNMTQQNSILDKINYTTGKENEINISTSIGQDDVLSMKSIDNEFIPLQQAFKNYVKITTHEFPYKAGNYKVTTNNSPIYTVSYNYDTKESKLDYATFASASPNKYSNSVSDYFNSSKANFKTTDLWKWFLIFALLFLIIEIILLKYL